MNIGTVNDSVIAIAMDQMRNEVLRRNHMQKRWSWISITKTWTLMAKSWTLMAKSWTLMIKSWKLMTKSYQLAIDDQE